MAIVASQDLLREIALVNANAVAMLINLHAKIVTDFANISHLECFRDFALECDDVSEMGSKNVEIVYVDGKNEKSFGVDEDTAVVIWHLPAVLLELTAKLEIPGSWGLIQAVKSFLEQKDHPGACG
jgi:hypothetical protein